MNSRQRRTERRLVNGVQQLLVARALRAGAVDAEVLDALRRKINNVGVELVVLKRKERARGDD